MGDGIFFSNMADVPSITIWMTALILALVVFVIVLPALCTAVYHFIAYKKGWDYDEEDFICDLNLDEFECGSECSECRKEFAEEGKVSRREHWQYYFKVMQAINEQAKVAAATARANSVVAEESRSKDEHDAQTSFNHTKPETASTLVHNEVINPHHQYPDSNPAKSEDEENTVFGDVFIV